MGQLDNNKMHRAEMLLLQFGALTIYRAQSDLPLLEPHIA